MNFPLEEHDYDPKLEPVFLLMMLECGDPTTSVWGERQWEAFNDILFAHAASPIRNEPQTSLIPGNRGIHGSKAQKNILAQYAVWYIREHNRRQMRATVDTL